VISGLCCGRVINETPWNKYKDYYNDVITYVFRGGDANYVPDSVVCPVDSINRYAGVLGGG
tara:strand:+ start:961 stop:1143 length:183 start_codon:yes stop_codon:yes gene_type:complete